MYYVRLLKPPTIPQDSSKPTKAVLTITTDLGDSFYPADVDLHLAIVISTRDSPFSSYHPSTPPPKTLLTQTLRWQAHMRVLPFTLAVPASPKRPLELHIKPRLALSSEIPPILPVSAQLSSVAPSYTTRPFISLSDPTATLLIDEHAGESIAKHVWDAGAALYHLLNSPDAHGLTPRLRALLLPAQPKKLRAVELGAGCGIFSLAAAQHNASLSVALSDLDDAREVCERNVLRFCTEHQGERSLEFVRLDWDDEGDLPPSVEGADVVLVSDCTYNPDSCPALVRIIGRIVRGRRDVGVVVGMKERHADERVFFKLMRDAGFVVGEEVRMDVPNGEGLEQDIVTVLLFQIGHETEILES